MRRYNWHSTRLAIFNATKVAQLFQRFRTPWKICMSCVCCSESERALDSRDIIINLLMTVPLNRLIMTSLLRIIYVLYCYSRVVYSLL